MNSWRCLAKAQRTQRGMCLVQRGYGEDWDLAGKQAFRADIRSDGAWEDDGIEMDYT